MTTDSRETEKERVDRELIELLNELRVALPGVQVLFAFLLIVPFSERFAQLSGLQQAIYFGTFLATTGAAVFLMAPTTYHRIRFREGDKDQMLHTASRFAIAGAVLLAVAIFGVALLVTDVLYSGAFAVLIASGVLAVLAWCWFGLPLTRKARGR